MSEAHRAGAGEIQCGDRRILSAGARNWYRICATFAKYTRRVKHTTVTGSTEIGTLFFNNDHFFVYHVIALKLTQTCALPSSLELPVRVPLSCVMHCSRYALTHSQIGFIK